MNSSGSCFQLYLPSHLSAEASCPVPSCVRGADYGITLPSSGCLAPVSQLSVPCGWLRVPSLSLSPFLFCSLSFFKKGFYPVKEKKKKLALGKQPTLLELRDNNQFLWACEIGSLSVLFNRKYWKRLSLLY